jgi:hypothetical protein
MRGRDEMVSSRRGLNLNQTTPRREQLPLATLVAFLVTGIGGPLVALGTRGLSRTPNGPAVLLRLILNAALASVLAVLDAALITAHGTARVTVAPEERLNTLLHPRITQFGDIVNARQIADAIAPEIERQSTAIDIEHAHAPRNGDEAAIAGDHRVFEAPIVRKHEVADGPKIDAALQQNVRSENDAALQEPIVIAPALRRDGSIRTELTVWNDLSRRWPRRRPRGTNNLGERALRGWVSNASSQGEVEKLSSGNEHRVILSCSF